MYNFDSYLQGESPNPDLLFHYTSHTTGLEKILYNRQLQFSTGIASHDPLEKDSLGFFAFGNAAGDPMVSAESARNSYNFGNEINEIRSRVKYACFCIDSRSWNDPYWDKACFRSRMWSQYAAAHSGMCLVFSKSKLAAAVEAHNSGFEKKFILQDWMHYDNDLGNLEGLTTIGPADTLEIAMNRMERNSKSYLFTKRKDYEGENEYRVCFYNDSKVERELVSYESSLLGVLVGQYFPDVYEKLLALFCKENDLFVKKISWVGYRKPVFNAVNV